MKTILESDKLSLAECRKILNVKGQNYSDDEILKIREWIYNMAQYTAEFLAAKRNRTDKK